MSTRNIRASACSLTIVPAIFLFHIGAAGAAGDAQGLARTMLLGVTVPAVAAAPNEQRGASTAGRTDAQGLARRMLLGVTSRSPGLTATGAQRVSGNRAHGDAQVLAHQALIGRRDARTTGS
jgi:hypothetical protein